MARSSVEMLPDEVLSELNQRLVGKRFSGYSDLADWLQTHGYEISRSALHRYGQKFEDRLAALKLSTDQARALVEASPDDAGLMNDATLRLCQERLFSTVVNLDGDDVEAIPKLSRAAADLSRASVQQKRWMAEVKSRVQAAAAEVAEVAQKAGLSDETLETIRARILGIA